MGMSGEMRKARAARMVDASVGGRYFCAWCGSDLRVLVRAKSWVFIRVVCDVCKRENKVL
jgi:hypothetical protein